MDMHRSFWDSVASGPAVGPALDEALLRKCERKWGVTFPKTLVELLRIQNGGVVRDCEEIHSPIMPLVDDEQFNFGMCIRPLSEWADRGSLVGEKALEDVEESHGDPSLIFPLWTDGHVCHALNFNKRGPHGDPSVVYFDFECCSDREEADRFDAWLAKLLQADDRPLVDWDEAARLPCLARERFS
ncbi:MAG: SMI1/KNR4 family protein, partial [Planctomycetes bacterium]|nr:SMI1/KNR4 family protein [Planctomycetota bacterium]